MIDFSLTPKTLKAKKIAHEGAEYVKSISRYYDEFEHEELKEEEKKNMQSQAQTHEFAIKELDIKLKELERRWEQEKMLLEDRVKAKETEAILEKTKYTLS